MNKPVKALIGSLLLASLFLLGYKLGFEASGKTFSQIKADEQEDKTVNYSQYLRQEASINETLSSSLYSHCVTYAGVGLVFSGKNENGEYVVQQVIGGSEVDKLKAKGIVIKKGDVIVTPLSIVRGDLNSPLKIEYRERDDKLKKLRTLLVTRKALTKCYLKESRQNPEDNDNLQVY